MKRKTKQITNLIKQEVAKIDRNAHVILYGSRARGNERLDSDWDILIITDYQVNIEKERQFRNALYELELELGEPFSVFVYSSDDWDTRQVLTPFYFNVNREGIRL